MAESAYTLQRVPLSTRIAPFNGDLRVHNPNGTSISSAVFAQMTAECPYTLQWFACFPLKVAPSHVGIWSYLHAKFHLDPSNRLATVHERYKPTRQTDRQDRQTDNRLIA